ncbi:MAG: hypothetical protein JSU70_20175 [Phycisphaerales bacterium]|nr:MAG: hypothetical protein JSU70_20175 [Phycisphaerales bacterium]
MTFDQSASCRSPIRRLGLILLLLTSPGLVTAQRHEKTLNTQVWDTQSPLVDSSDLRNRSQWRLVPRNFLLLEDDPAAAMADPGYYGREYSFKGDVVVENQYLTAVFRSKTGKVIAYSKTDSEKKRIQFIPLQLKATSAKITDCKILQNTGDEATLDVSFSSENGPETLSAVFSFDRKRIIEIRPAENMKGIALSSPVEYAVVPDFIGDDLVLDPGQYPSAEVLHVPSENLFLGLLQGESSMLVITWPQGKQEMRLILDNKGQESRLIRSVDFQNDGRSLYLAILDAPGIWHKEELKPSYLEKDVAINWKRPFPAKWVTQLGEAGVKTTFKFGESKQKRIWRAVTGAFVYPVWFEGDSACYHLSKKIPPEGDSLIYFLERQDTPVSVSSPVDIMKETLGREASNAILDLAGRTLRTHHRRGSVGIRRAATCGCTAAIEAVFKEGKEVEKKEYVEGAVGDMVYFVTRHMERIDEYQDFARDMIKFLHLTSKSNPDLKPFLDNMETITQQLLREYSGQRDNIKTLEYADQLARKTKALTEKRDPKNLRACSDLGAKWREMGGAQDYLVGKCHSITRRLSQEAGYRCVNQPRAVGVAEEIRRRCRKCLRNPDGYEIWAGY